MKCEGSYGPREGELPESKVLAVCVASTGCEARSQASRRSGHTVKVQGLVGMQGPLQSEGGLGTRLHLHDDGFLGDFSLLFGDYKENSRNSEGYRSASI